jgi:hypothetical protein
MSTAKLLAYIGCAASVVLGLVHIFSGDVAGGMGIVSAAITALFAAHSGPELAK